VIGEGGLKLSGGEKQRITLARAILKNAPIVILDEATAYIDADNEDLLQKALAKLSEGKTVLVIAHRLSSIKEADSIVVLEQGKVIDCVQTGYVLFDKVIRHAKVVVGE
jgi:ATP-binding cassette subfamily B protein